MKKKILLFLVFLHNLSFFLFAQDLSNSKSDSITVTYLRTVMNKKTSEVRVPIEKKVFEEMEFFNYQWPSELLEKYELYRLPSSFHTQTKKQLIVFEYTDSNTLGTQVIWNKDDNIGHSTSFHIYIPGMNKKGKEFQKVYYQITLFKKLYTEQDTFCVLLFSTKDFQNLDYKIILNGNGEFCGMIDVDDMASGFIAFNAYLDVVRKYYYDEDWW